MEEKTNDYILVANPGSSSRKYALYNASLSLRAELHFETEDNAVVCSLEHDGRKRRIAIDFDDLTQAAAHLNTLLVRERVIATSGRVAAIGLRIVAPSVYFMEHRLVTDEIVSKLEGLRELAPLHIDATLTELALLRQSYGNLPIVGVSDSAFHRTKPNYAWNYGINIHDADRLDIKRFGYHGLSVAASIDALWDAGKLAPKVIVCHLGSGSSVTGVFHGRSIDTTMGFTPLEGVLMATRSGTIDPSAVEALKRGLNLSQEEIDTYLHQEGGLKGLGGSSDVRELLEREANGNHLANLALTTLVHTIHKAIGQMLVALNGADVLVFTGTIGERSAIVRKRIVAHLEFMDFIIDGTANTACTNPMKLTSITQKAKSRPIIVIPTNESLEIARQVRKLVDIRQ